KQPNLRLPSGTNEGRFPQPRYGGPVERGSSRCARGRDRKTPEQNVSDPLGTGGGIVMTRLGPVILIVEDEFLLRLDSAETIESADFGVIQAANPGEAIAFLRARPDIHVVFTDIQMPGSMDGLKLARFVRGPLAADQDRGDL